MKKGIVGLIICLSVFLVIGYFEINNKDNTILKNTKMVTKQNNNMLSLMLETSSGSGDYAPSTDGAWPSEGYSFNASLSKCENGSEITWDNTAKTVNFNGSVSDKCYVYFDLVPPAKYWNDNFSGKSYAFPNTPGTTYESVNALITGYNNFTNKPYYIKTTATEYQVCLYNEATGKEFCLKADYWVKGDTDGSATKAKLKADMESALGVPTSSCSSSTSEAYCIVLGSFECSTTSSGGVYCTDRAIGGCTVSTNDSASCE